MELNIPNPQGKNLGEAFGITDERQKQMQDMMHDLGVSYGRSAEKGQLVRLRWQHVIADIAAFCSGPEELSYCLIVHCAWHQKHGHRIAPYENENQ